MDSYISSIDYLTPKLYVLTWGKYPVMNVGPSAGSQVVFSKTFGRGNALGSSLCTVKRIVDHSWRFGLQVTKAVFQWINRIWTNWS